MIHFIKMKVFPLLCGHQHMLWEDLCEWNSLWVTVLCVVKKTKVISLLYSLKSFFRPVFASVDRKALTFCKLNLNPSTPFLKNGKLLVAIWWSVVTYPSCCCGWRWLALPLRYLSLHLLLLLYAVFPNFSFQNLFIDTVLLPFLLLQWTLI